MELIGLCWLSGKHLEVLQGDRQGQRGFLEVQPARGSRKGQYGQIWAVKCPVLVHSVFQQEFLGIHLLWPHGLEHSIAGWVLWVSGALPMAERTPVLQAGPDCSNWQGQESPLTGAALLQTKQTPAQARDVQGAVRAAPPSWKEQMKVNLDMHSLVYCFDNTFTLKCCCSREAIAPSQEVACLVIRITVAPKGRDGTVWADSDLPRTLAPGTPPGSGLWWKSIH